MKARIARHPVAAFVLLAYLFSWIVAVPLALAARGVIHAHLPFALHYVTAFGPALAAWAVARFVRSGAAGGRTRTPGPHGRGYWLALAALSPLALFAIGRVGGALAGQATPGWIALGRVNFLPALGVAAWLLWLATNGFGEEYGWRGFALPHLQQRRSAFASSVLVAVAWAGWHLPAFFYVPSYAAIGLAILPGFFVGVLSGSIVLTWLYNRSGGSVLAAALWHASFNFVTASPSASGFSAAVTSTLVIVWAVGILWYCDWETFTARRVRSIRAGRNERVRPLPGDDLITDSIGQITHAITIRRSPHDVWQWLAQMGAGRAGWYSYDRLDNGGTPSATTIRPELQEIAVGTVMPGMPGIKEGFVVVSFERDRFLTLGWPSAGGGYGSTWTFVLEPRDDGATRLIVRVKARRGYRLFGLPSWCSVPPIHVVHYIMERRQLLGLRRRAEARA